MTHTPKSENYVPDASQIDDYLQCQYCGWVFRAEYAFTNTYGSGRFYGASVGTCTKCGERNRRRISVPALAVHGKLPKSETEYTAQQRRDIVLLREAIKELMYSHQSLTRYGWTIELVINNDTFRSYFTVYGSGQKFTLGHKGADAAARWMFDNRKDAQHEQSA